MQRYIVRANIDHYVALLNGTDLSSDCRNTAVKLLIAEEDKLGRDLEQLEFVEHQAAAGRDRVKHMRKLRDGFAFGTPERLQADRAIVNAENLQTILEDTCHRLRRSINSSGL